MICFVCVVAAIEVMIILCCYILLVNGLQSSLFTADVILTLSVAWISLSCVYRMPLRKQTVFLKVAEQGNADDGKGLVTSELVQQVTCYPRMHQSFGRRTLANVWTVMSLAVVMVTVMQGRPDILEMERWKPRLT